MVGVVSTKFGFQMGALHARNRTFTPWSDMIGDRYATAGIHASACQSSDPDLLLLQVTSSDNSLIYSFDIETHRITGSVAAPDQLASLRFPYCL